MKENDLLSNPTDSKKIKLLYNSIKQDINNLKSINTKFNSIIKKNITINSKNLTNINKSKFTKKIKMEKNNLNMKLNNKSLNKIEKRIHNKFIKFYQTNKDFYNTKIINEIISNEKNHIVSQFKDFLIKEDTNEFFIKLYTKNESISLLKKIFDYFNLSLIVYPNYIILPERKYIYNNIKKKQKIINLQKNEGNNDIEEEKLMIIKDNNISGNTNEKVFNSKEIESIFNLSNSSNIKNIISGLSNENSTDIERRIIQNIIKKIKKAEENNYYKFKFIEKKKNNNKIISNQNNYKFKNGIIMINNLKIKNFHDLKNSLINEEIKTINKEYNNKNFIEHSKIKKIKTNITSDFKLDKLKYELRNIKRKGNLYSLYLNKNKNEKIKDIKNKINSYYNPHKKNNISLNSIYKGKERKQYSRNFQSNVLDSIENIKLSTLNYFLKKDFNISKNNHLDNIKNNVKNKNSYLNKNKEKTRKNNKIKLNFIDKKVVPKIINRSECNIERNNNFYNNRQIKKSVIDELLLSISSAKETCRNSRLTESFRELSHRSMNFTDRRKMNINNTFSQNEIEFKKNINKSDTYENISKYFYSNKNKVDNSLGKDIIKNNEDDINNHYNSFGKNFNKRYKNKNSSKKDIYNFKKSTTLKKNKDHCRYFSNQFLNGEVNNLINKTKQYEGRNEKKLSSINKIKNKNYILNTNPVNKIVKINYNFFTKKKYKNKNSYLYDKSNTFSKKRKKRFIKNNLNNNISVNNNNFNINFIKSYQAISSISSKLNNNKKKLNADITKDSKFNKQKRNINIFQKIYSKKYKHFFKSENKKLFKGKIKYNSKLNNIQRQFDLSPLSERISCIINDESNKLSQSLNNKSKSKNKNKKYPLNEVSSLTISFINDFKNKKIKNNSINNNSLGLSIIKKEEEKQIIIKMNNKKKISSNKLSISNFNNSDMNSFYINTLNSTISKISNSINNKKNNYKINENYYIKGIDLIKISNIRNNFKKSTNNNLRNNCEKNNNKTQNYGRNINVNESLKIKTYKEKKFIKRIKENINKHFKYNSMHFTKDNVNNLNENINSYSINYNSNSNAKGKKMKIIKENKNYKKISNMKCNINKVNGLKIGKKNNNTFFPASITERNNQNQIFIPLNKLSGITLKK